MAQAGRLGDGPEPRIVIGIDPGLASLGYGVVSESNGQLHHLAHGCISTSPRTPSGERLLQIYEALKALIETYGPSCGGVEDLYFFRNVTSALPVAEARGIIKLVFAQAGVPLAEFTPNAIKKAVTGSARADKLQVQEMVRFLLGLDKTPSPDHAADALAAAICRINHSGPAGILEI